MTDRSKFVPPSKVNMGGGYDKINVGCLVCLPSGGPIMKIILSDQEFLVH